MDNWSKFYQTVYANDPAPEGAYGWIQWKGTEVCMDVTCACGQQVHFDAEFLYFIKCASCGQRYAVGQHVKLIPLSQELIDLGGIDKAQIKEGK